MKTNKKVILQKIKKRTIIFLLFLLIFIVIRFLDFSLLWHFMSPYFFNNFFEGAKISYSDDNNPNRQLIDAFYKNIVFKEIGFSLSRNEAAKELAKLKKIRDKQIVIVSYYDIFHPLVYLIYNKGDDVYLSDQHFTIDSIHKGLSKITFYKEEYRWVTYNNKKDFRMILILGNSCMYLSGMSIVHVDGSTEFSDLVLSLYFYIPYLAIFLLLFFLDSSIFLALFCYIEMFLFFGPPGYFIEKSNSFFYSLFKIESLGLYIGYLQVLVLIILFVYGIYYSIKNKKIFKTKKIEKYVIIFFIMLPFLLRFSFLSIDKLLWLFLKVTGL